MTTANRRRALTLGLAMLAAVLLTVLVAVRPAQAAAGDLDPTFGDDGKVVTEIGARSHAQDVAVQDDGKVVVAGWSDEFEVGQNGNFDFTVARYNSDGSLDTTFGNGGKLTTDFGSTDDVANAVAIQSDGKIVVAGSSVTLSNDGFPIGGTRNFAMARYNPDGSLDTTFGSGGKLTTDFANGDDVVNALIIRDGKILAAGDAQDGVHGPFQFALARYDASDGSLDDTFGSGGKVTTPFLSGDGFNEINDLALQPDGKIVAAGYLGDFFGDGSGFESDFAMARYNPDGSLDTTFDDDGKLVEDFGGEFNEAEAVAVQPDGKIVVAGHGFGDVTLARFAGDGSLDTSFGGGDGIVESAFYVAEDIVLQPGGKIVGAGGAGSQGTSAGGTFALERYNSNGSLDTTFGGGDGRTFTGFGSSTYSSADAAALQPDGKLILAGRSDAIDGGNNQFSNNHFALARYEGGAGATPDTTAPSLTGFGPRGARKPTTVNAFAAFSERVTGVNAASFKLTTTVVRKVRGKNKRVVVAVPAAVTYNAATRRATLNPRRNLKPGAVYRATVNTQVKDLAGNKLAAAKTWTFKVKPRPKKRR